MSKELADDVNRIAAYLALDDFGGQPIVAAGVRRATGRDHFDVVAVPGNQVTTTLAEACSLVRSGLAGILLVSGGRGHSTELLYRNLSRLEICRHIFRRGLVREGWSEAEMLAAVAHLAFGIPRDQILVECQSANTGENARFTLAVLAASKQTLRNTLVLQDPLMQRRTMLTFAQEAQAYPSPPRFFGHAVFVPQLIQDAERCLHFLHKGWSPHWTTERFLSLLLGEIRRMGDNPRGYGPRGRGFLPHVAIPQEVLDSYDRLSAVLPEGLQR